VVLQFTLPQSATDGKPLSGPARVEIHREFLAAGPAGAVAVSGPAAFTLSAQQLAGSLSGGVVTWADALSADAFQEHRGQRLVYRVRTAAGASEWSALSKPAGLILAIPPAPPRGLTATVSGGAVLLRWQAPKPGPSPPPETYLVYRRAAEPAGAAEFASPLGATAETTFQDAQVEPNRAYRYTVRSVARENGQEVESADSQPVVVLIPAAAPPAPPAGLQAIAVFPPGGSPEVDLSWEIGSEANLAGYNVYRSERPGERGVRLNGQALAAPAFQDATVIPGRSYTYTVTAVDTAGKESPPSAPVRVAVPAENAPQGKDPAGT